MNDNNDWKMRLENYYKEKYNNLLNYDQYKHLELLNQKTDKVNPKLKSYSLILLDQINWEIRDQYLTLIKNYLEKKIEFLTFQTKFLERVETAENVANFLTSNRILLSPNKKSLEFARLLTNIENACEFYSDDPIEFRQKHEIGDIEFQNLIKKVYLKMEEIVKKE